MHIDRTIVWRAGEGTPIKYQVQVVGHTELGEIVDTPTGKTGVLYYDFNVTVTNHPYNSRNSFSAADFAVLAVGDLTPRDNYPLPDGRSLYGEPMLCPTNLPTDQVLCEFRGDTYAASGPNKVSLWADGTTRLDSSVTEGDYEYHLIGTRAVDLTGAHDQPILTWTTSGAGVNHTEWLTQEVWSTYIDFDYIPGAVLNGSNVWLSHNRATNGVAKVFNGSAWSDNMRTVDGGSGTNDPPLIKHASGWKNMRKIGQE